MMNTFNTKALLVLTLAGFASARLGVGQCPTVTGLSAPFGVGGTVADGSYKLMAMDNQFFKGWQYALQPGETQTCKSATITKQSGGFTWAPDQYIDAFSGWAGHVACNADGTCTSPFPGQNFKTVYYNAGTANTPVPPTIALYTCFQLSQAQTIVNGYTSLDPTLKGYINTALYVASSLLANHHFSMVLIASQHPTQISPSQLSTIETQILAKVPDTTTGYCGAFDVYCMFTTPLFNLSWNAVLTILNIAGMGQSYGGSYVLAQDLTWPVESTCGWN